MNTSNQIYRAMQTLSSLLILCCAGFSAHATLPKFAIVPTTTVVLSVPINRTAVVQYTVTNHTKLTRTLTIVPMKGVTQDTSNVSYCSSPFTLAPQGSCLLTLSINANQIVPNIHSGPVVCKTVIGRNEPDLFLCSQPIADDLISVTQTSAVSSSDQAVYVANFATNSISLCFANAQSGLLENCNIAAIGGTISTPEGVTTNPDATFLYIANPSASVSFCKINSQTGALSDCQNTGSGFASPDGIAINPANTFAYASNVEATVTMCEVNASTGALSNCQATGSNMNTPFGMCLNAAGTRAYIVNEVGSVTNCAIDSITGLLTCGAPLTGFSTPEGITLNALDSIAYVANNGNNTISHCQVNAITGALTACHPTAAAFDGFGNVAFNAAGTQVYVPRSATSTVDLCTVNQTTGEFTDCINSGGTGFGGTAGIVVATLP